MDTIWSIAFNALSPNARSILGVLALLSPDKILIDLFLPSDQIWLDGRLEFCRQKETLNPNTRAALSEVLNPSAAFQEAIDELLAANLIRLDGRDISMHRVIQEAMNYYTVEDLQKSLDAAVSWWTKCFQNRKAAVPCMISGLPLRQVYNMSFASQFNTSSAFGEATRWTPLSDHRISLLGFWAIADGK